MYLTHKINGDFVEILDLPALFDPCEDCVKGRLHAGEELQEIQAFTKADLAFPSGEGLPRCWTDAGYRQARARA